MAGHDPDDVGANACRVAQPLQDPVGELGARRGVAPVAPGLPRSWSRPARRTSRGSPASAVRERPRSSARRGQRLAVGAQRIADRRAELRDDLGSTPVSRASRSARAGFRPSRSFESSPWPSALIPPPIRSAETWASPGTAARIWASVPGASRSRAGRRSAGPHEPQRILLEARRADCLQRAALEIARPRRRDRPAGRRPAGSPLR